MTTDSVRVIARVTAQPDTVDALRAVLAGLVEPTRREPGCISYVLTQDRNHATEFLFIEEWASDAAIEAHMKTSHVQAAFAAAGPLLGNAPDIRTYRAIA